MPTTTSGKHIVTPPALTKPSHSPSWRRHSTSKLLEHSTLVSTTLLSRRPSTPKLLECYPHRMLFPCHPKPLECERRASTRAPLAPLPSDAPQTPPPSGDLRATGTSPRCNREELQTLPLHVSPCYLHFVFISRAYCRTFCFSHNVCLPSTYCLRLLATSPTPTRTLRTVCVHLFYRPQTNRGAFRQKIYQRRCPTLGNTRSAVCCVLPTGGTALERTRSAWEDADAGTTKHVAAKGRTPHFYTRGTLRHKLRKLLGRSGTQHQLTSPGSISSNRSSHITSLYTHLVVMHYCPLFLVHYHCNSHHNISFFCGWKTTPVIKDPSSNGVYVRIACVSDHSIDSPSQSSILIESHSFSPQITLLGEGFHKVIRIKN